MKMKSRSRTRQPRSTTRDKIALGRWSAIVIVLLAVLVGCEPAVTGLEPTAPSDVLGDGNPAAGRIAFVQECAQCHASRDGYDLAAFNFSSFDVIRRSLSHVDSATSRDIAAYIAEYIETLEPNGLFGRSPFQPGARVGDGDREYWTDAFGTSGWPTDLTADALRGIDPRSLQVPLAMPEWSLEGSNEDWMPDVPLPTQVLDHSGGAIRTGLAAYYADPTESGLLRVLAPFKAATEGPGLVCSQSDPDVCFNARRWMATLGALHYLRLGPPVAVPPEVTQVWWDVGATAILLLGDSKSTEPYPGFDAPIPWVYRVGARWMYLAYSYHPEAYNEPFGYMGPFLQAQGLPRVSLFVALRRMVGNGLAHQEHADQFLQDGLLAIGRADDEVGPGVTAFVFEYYIERLEAGRPAGLHLIGARELVRNAWDEGQQWLPENSAELARVEALHERVVELLQ